MAGDAVVDDSAIVEPARGFALSPQELGNFDRLDARRCLGIETRQTHEAIDQIAHVHQLAIDYPNRRLCF